MSEPKPVAWYVGTSEVGEIVYAPTRGRARYIGSGAMDCDYVEVETCKRAPQWDVLYPKGPSQEQLFNTGWWFECNCGCIARAGEGESEWIDGEPVCHDCVVARAPSPSTPHGGAKADEGYDHR